LSWTRSKYNTKPIKSYLLTVACIISTAQHAKPKVIGQKEPCLAHDTTALTGINK